MTRIPDGHPARMLSDFDLASADLDDNFHPPFLTVNISGGRREPDTKSLRHWWAEASVENVTSSGPGLKLTVARMHCTVAHPLLGYPATDLDHIDEDSAVLGAALFDDQERTGSFEAIANDWGPVVLVNSYVVEPGWRGTGYTPFIAARILDMFSHLGVSAAALQAAPMARLSAKERARVSGKIAAMWEQVGFKQLSDAPEFMAMPLDPIYMADTLERLIERYDLPDSACEG